MSKNFSKLLVLVDGMAMVYRAYFALIGRPLMNTEGKNTSAVYGFVNSMVSGSKSITSNLSKSFTFLR